MANDYAEKADELEEIRSEMADLLERAKQVLRRTGIIERRAEAYWIGHIETAISDEGGSATTLGETIAELREAAGPEECPDCGCKPGEGYTDGCPACMATVESLYDRYADGAL